ncbi:MAG: hypothetical protein FJ254_10205 [Phycisphaerae bacterium]|nr:hypothetical protein [Phycisphaerae bacterium]
MSQFNDATGYNQEEAEFKRREQEQIAALRRKLDEERAANHAAASQQANWMRCPKCGNKLAEVRRGDVLVDRCGGCGGIFLDQGEIDLLLTQSKGSPLGWLFGR